ncbi:MAG: flavodoxin family protein [Deltaproteobacteria bacterium]|nr:flavodoxin family protein [Deltaproteobacteria bacterium]
MKITTILGSPKKNGNTAAFLEQFEKIMEQNNEINRINIKDKNVNGCLGCGSCRKKPDAIGCVQKDDGVSIFEQMLDSDLIIYASPLYCWGFTAQLKALVDRHFCMVKEFSLPHNHVSLLENKKVALLVTCGGPVENNADLIQTAFERLAFYIKSKIAGKFILPFCSDINIAKTQGATLAQQMADRLTEKPIA